MARHILDSRSCCWKIRSAKEQPGLVSCTMNCCEFQPRLRVSGASPGTGGCWCLFGSDSQMKSVCSWNSSTSLSPSGCVQEQRTAQMPQSYPCQSFSPFEQLLEFCELWERRGFNYSDFSEGAKTAAGPKAQQTNVQFKCVAVKRIWQSGVQPILYMQVLELPHGFG